jgi:hypothetical protein
MAFPFKRRVLAVGGASIAATIGLTLAGLGMASAQTADDGTTPTRFERFVERFAGHLGVGEDQVTEALKLTSQDALADAVAEGKLTQEQADELLDRIESGEGVPFGGFKFGFGGHGHGPGGHEMLGFGPMGVVEALGMTPEELRDALESGQTLQQVIEANGKTVAEVVDAAVAEHSTRLAEAVAAGRLTQAEADEKLADLEERLTQAITEGTFGPFRGPGMDDDGTRFEGFPGMRGVRLGSGA